MSWYADGRTIRATERWRPQTHFWTAYGVAARSLACRKDDSIKHVRLSPDEIMQRVRCGM